MKELRRERRIAVRAPVRLRFRDGRTGVGMVRDLSLLGMFVQTAARPRCNPCVDTRLVVPTPLGERTLLITGWMVHARPEGIGLVFAPLEGRAVEGLSRLLSPDSMSESYPRPAGAGGIGWAWWPARG